MKDLELEQLVALMRAGDLTLLEPPEEIRRKFEAMLANIPVAPDISFSSAELGGVPCVVASAPGAAADAALLYLHGGGYVFGSASGYRGLAGALGAAAGVTAYAIDYRLAPEHPCPAAVDDALAAYEALLHRSIAPGRIIVAGDSAGGGLALAMLVAARDMGVPMPAAAFLLSPWADLGCGSGTMSSKAAQDPSLTEAGLRACARHYLGVNDTGNPVASPVNADLSELPQVLIQVGSAEILLDDAVNVAGALGAANVFVRLEIWPEMIHVFQTFAFMLTAGRRAVADAGAFLAARLQRPLGAPVT